MKAMILAAGRGDRMRPLTDETPKPLLMAGSKRLIEYHLLNLAQAGFKEVIINVAWLGEQIISTIGSGDAYNLKISYSDEGDAALETGGGIFNALPLLGDEPFLVINGDVFTDYSYEKLFKFKLDVNDKAHLVLVNNPQQHPQGDFAIEAGRLTGADNNKFTFSGIGIYSADFFASSQNGKFPLAPMIRLFIAENKISGEIYQGEWMDIGTPQRLAELDKLINKKQISDK